MVVLRNFFVVLFTSMCLIARAATSEVDSVRMSAPVLNEVVVTSSKDGRKLKELPASVSVLTSTELGKQNIRNIKDISSLIPNLFFPDYGSKLTSPVYIRGIGSKINSPSIGLYVDGIPYFEKSVFDFELDDVESIEVLRGPQGTLYGRNTMGGIIHVITKNPLETQGSQISLTGGTYGRRELSASHYGRFLPALGYSVSGKYDHSDGFFINRYTGKTADKLNEATANGKLVWKASPSLSIKLNLRYDKLDQNGYPYAPIDSAGRIGAVNYDSASSYRRDMFAGALVMDKNWRNVQLKSVTSLQTLSDRQAIDQDFSVKPAYFVTQDQKQRLWTEELEAHSSGNNAYKWILGFFAFDQTATNHTKINTVLKDYNMPSRGLAFYHQSTLNDLFIPGLSLTAGIRYDYEKESQDYLYRKPSGSTMNTISDLSSNLDFSQWSPKVSLQYRTGRTGMTYVSVTRGYKTGGFNTSFDTDKDQTFKPEYSWNYEIGRKYNFCENRFNGELSLFYTDWKNQQISQPLASGIGSQLRNAGQSYSKGVEFSLLAVLLKNWNANLNYGYTEAKFKDYRAGINDYTGNFIPYIPNHTLMLGTDYTFPINKPFLDKAILSCQYIETGKLYWNDGNTASQDTYGTVNGKLSLLRKNLTLDLWVKNATSTEYTAFYFEMSNKPFGQKGKPRTLGVTLSLHF